MGRRGDSERQFGEEEEAVPGKGNKNPEEEMSLICLERKEKNMA